MSSSKEQHINQGYSSMEKVQVLIVEDDGTIAMNIESQLKQLGCGVTAIVGYGEEAIVKVKENKPDVVLMDIVLKGEIDGIEAAKEIRTQFDIPVIFLTAFADKDRLERAKLTYPFGFILKPFQNKDLSVTIEMALYIAKADAERKQAEEALKKRTRELELKTKSLEELNAAMKVLLKKKTVDKTEIEENVMTNVKELIAPYFEKIKKTKLDDHQEAFVNILESNLNEIVSPFTRKLSLKYLRLTPKEIQIVNMIKIGYPSKKIAKIMKISPRTVDTHRKNIRSKIGLGQKRANLRSYLLAHEQ